MKTKNWKSQSFSKSFKVCLILSFLSGDITLTCFAIQKDELLQNTSPIKEDTDNGNTLLASKSNSPNLAVSLTKTTNKKEYNPWMFLHDYRAEYLVSSDGQELGHSTRILTKNEQQWLLTTSAKINKYLLTVKSNEATSFHFDNHTLLTDHFISKTKISFKKARTMEQNFDWINGIEQGSRKNKKWTLKLEQQVFDRISHIVQLRADLLAGKKKFSYDVSYKGKFRQYNYFIEKREHLITKMGELSAVKLTRNKPNGDQFSIWLSPELNYFPIKIAQYEKGESDVTLLLKSLNYQQSTE